MPKGLLHFNLFPYAPDIVQLRPSLPTAVLNLTSLNHTLSCLYLKLLRGLRQ